MTVPPASRDRSHALRLSVAYVALALAWIFVSDLVLAALLPMASSLLRIELLKGAIFVVVTGGLLYLFLVRSERTLLRDEARLELLLGQFPGLLWTTDRDLRIDSMMGSLGGFDFEPGSLVGTTVTSAVTAAETRAVIESNHRRALASEPANYQLRLEGRELAVRVEPLRDEIGRVSGTVGFALELSPSIGGGDAGSVRGALQRNQALGALGGFVLEVAHQLKNPLFALSAALDAFEARTADDPATARHRAIMRQQVKRIEELVSGLQVYGRIDDLELKRADLVPLVQRCLRQLGAEAEAAGVMLEWRLPPNPVPVRADDDALVRALRRLLKNAIQSAPPGSVVEVEATAGRDTLEVSVADRGPGFDPLHLERVFEPMFARRPGGAGLGLAIAERIVQRHGGSIEAANRSGGGALVTIRLPAD